MANTKITTNVIADNAVGITQLNVSDGSNGQVLTTNGSGTLSFTTISAGVAGISTSADATAITIDSSERVGIGCTDQSNLLTVDVNSASAGTDSISVRNKGVTSANSHTSGLRFQFNSAVSSAIRSVLTNTQNGAGTLSFLTSSDGTAGNLSEHMRITSAGGIGFGSTSPSSYGGGNFEFSDTSSNQTGVRITAATKSAEIGVDNDGGYLQTVTDGGGWRFYTSNGGVANTTPLLITAAGNIGIGTISPANNLHIHTDAGDEGLTIKSTGNTSNAIIFDANRSGSGNSIGEIQSKWNGTTVAMIASVTGDDTTNKDDGYISFYASAANDLAERMRVTRNNGVYFGDIPSFANNTYAHAAVFSKNSTPNGTVVIEDSDVSSGIGNTVLFLYLRDSDPANFANYIIFRDGDAQVGAITHNDDGGGVTYGSSSDYRLKENVNYTWEAIPLLKQLKPAKFNFKRNPSKTIQGLLAHEVADIVPSSVRGDKDHMEPIGTIKDSKGNVVSEKVYEHFCKTDEGQTWTKTGTEPVYQQLDYSRLVPLLTKSLQEQQTIIEDLKSRIATLESK